MSEEIKQGTKKSCFCEQCKSACNFKPGWFLPGEAEQVSIYLKISLEDLFKTRLAVDWWVSGSDIFVLSPAIINGDVGEEFPSNPRGICIFFKQDLCEIHPVKPFECREMVHDEKLNKRHKGVANTWIPYQHQIVELPGRKPKSKSFTLFDAILGGNF